MALGSLSKPQTADELNARLDEARAWLANAPADQRDAVLEEAGRLYVALDKTGGSADHKHPKPKLAGSWEKRAARQADLRTRAIWVTCAEYLRNPEPFWGEEAAPTLRPFKFSDLTLVRMPQRCVSCGSAADQNAHTQKYGAFLNDRSGPGSRYLSLEKFPLCDECAAARDLVDHARPWQRGKLALEPRLRAERVREAVEFSASLEKSSRGFWHTDTVVTIRVRNAAFAEAFEAANPAAATWGAASDAATPSAVARWLTSDHRPFRRAS